MNPRNSIWYTKSGPNFRDQMFALRWARIQRHLTTSHNVNEWKSWISVDNNVYIAKHSTKFRLKSHLDWAWYTPRSLAQAIDSGTMDAYYEFMLRDPNSDPNIWSDHDLEMRLKAFYAERVGRCQQI